MHRIARIIATCVAVALPLAVTPHADAQKAHRHVVTHHAVKHHAKKAKKRHAPAHSGPAQRVGGDPDDWAYFLPGTVMRWDPCTPISVVWDVDATSGSALAASRTAMVKEAISELGNSTGLTFVLSGAAASTPDHGILIRWTTASGDPDLKGAPVGMGGPDSVELAPDGTLAIDTATVSMDEDLPSYYHDGFGVGWSTGSDLLHELGHAVGLGHAKDDHAEIMGANQYGDSPATYQAGDLSGLKAIGAGAGCL